MFLNEAIELDYAPLDIKVTSGISSAIEARTLPELITEYVYDLKDGMAQLSTHPLKTDKNGTTYEELTMSDLKWYCEVKGCDVEMPKWINDFTIKVYARSKRLYAEGWVVVPSPTAKDIEFLGDSVNIHALYAKCSSKFEFESTLAHELTHCYDFFKAYKKHSGKTFLEVTQTGNDWKKPYDIDIDDAKKTYGIKAEDIAGRLSAKEKESLDAALGLLCSSPERLKELNYKAFFYLLRSTFYYIDSSEIIAFMTEQKNRKKQLKSEKYKEDWNHIRKMFLQTNKVYTGLFKFISNIDKMPDSVYKGLLGDSEKLLKTYELVRQILNVDPPQKLRNYIRHKTDEVRTLPTIVKNKWQQLTDSERLVSYMKEWMQYIKLELEEDTKEAFEEAARIAEND